MRKNNTYYLRKAHRYLGLAIGIQFLAWTISGLYFSWTNIDSVHGDDMHKPPHYLASSQQWVSPQVVLEQLAYDSLVSIQSVNLAGSPLYLIRYFSGHAGEGHHLHTYTTLADAQTGHLRGPLTKEEAVLLANDHIIASAQLDTVEYISEIGAHHEYRGGPLPAWILRYSEPNMNVYVSAESGRVEKVRNTSWRIFDFLWMLHIMDFETRDDINNYLLRGFSILGFITVGSGFMLFFATLHFKRKKR
ncbi:hypothetical protein QWY31_15975 [Cytophagales bacterium LB-30]|uniref:PepSY domain-containing protein n=1 Tax=Shiella aurantiaca TaxID=3058365 RepID=A0ABT8F988_9BACT|nr:hypothetical protein [Shiella aurantiaca]MDN4167010.1 hypothetical protein [Shiella aurantiaca]